MSSDTLSIYSETLAAQLGEDGIFTERAVIDPDGIHGDPVEIWGIFEDNTKVGNKDSGHVEQKTTGPRFITASISNIDVYDDYAITFPDRGEEYKFIIQYINRDMQGAQVLWLA